MCYAEKFKVSEKLYGKTKTSDISDFELGPQALKDKLTFFCRQGDFSEII